MTANGELWYGRKEKDPGDHEHKRKEWEKERVKINGELSQVQSQTVKRTDISVSGHVGR